MDFLTYSKVWSAAPGATNNDITGLTISSIQFTGDSGFNLTGNPITLAGDTTVSNGNVDVTSATGNALGRTETISLPLVQQTVTAGVSLYYDHTYEVGMTFEFDDNGIPDGEAANTLVIDGTITGPLLFNSLDKTDTGELDINGSLNFGGAVSDEAGLLQLGDDVLPSSSAVAVTVAAGAGLESGTNTFGSLSGAGSVTSLLNGHTAATLTIGTDNTDTTFTGVISGEVSVIKAGTGTLTLGAVNTFTGGLTIQAGEITQLTADTVPGVAVEVDAGGTLDLGGYGGQFGSLTGAGTVTNGGGNIVTLTTGGDNTSTTFTGDIVSGINLVKTGTGTFTLGAANGFVGSLTVAAGTLAQGANNAVPSNDVEVDAGATLDLHTYDATIAGLTGAGTVSSQGSATLTVGANNESSSWDGDISGDIALVKTGIGTFTLNAANDFNGGGLGLTISSLGTIAVGANDAIPFGFDVNVQAGAWLDLQGHKEVLGSLSGAGNIVSNPSAIATLTTGDDNTSTTFSGTIAGNIALVKVGTGKFKLAGVNTYTGSTTVDAGTLAQGVADAIPAGHWIIAAGAAINLNGYDCHVGSVSGDPGSVITTSTDPTLTVGLDNTSTTFSGVISGTINLVKVGSGTFTLAGANTYTGSTSVLAGTLQVTGSLSPSSTVSVAPGAVLISTSTLANITITGTGGGDTFVIDTTGVTVNGIQTISAPYTTLTVSGVGSSDTFDVLGTNAGSTTILNTGGGGNTFNVGSAANTLDPIQGNVTVNGSGSDTLTVDDQGTATVQGYDVYANQVTRYGAGNALDMAPVSYAGVSHLIVHSGTGGTENLLGVVSTAPGTTLDFYSHGYEGEFALDGLDNTMNGIQGPVHLHSNSTADFVEFVDELNPVGQTYTLTANTLTRTGMAPVTFDPMGQVILTAPQSASTGSKINLQAVAAGTFVQIALGTNNTLTVGSKAPALGGTLAAILGPVNAEADTASTGTVILDDSGDMNVEHATLAPDTTYTYEITNLTPSPIYLAQVGKATLDAGKGTNTFAVQGLPQATTLTVNGGTGSNTLTGPNQATTWAISGANSGSLGKLKFTHVQNLVGGSASDVFKFSASGSLSGSVNGGGGGDWLDYSAFASTSPVSVNLVTGAATAVAGGVTNIANVRGGAGNDTLIGGGGNILVGGGGNDVLTDTYSGSSATGGSLMIGGLGSDTVTGGSAGDILIGEATSYDTKNANLQDILTEWDTATSHAVAFAALKSTAGVGATHSRLFWGTTVKDDSAADVLIGATTPADADWFFAGSGDSTNARHGIDYVNNGLA